MLGNAFRRQLLMDGQFDRLVFVATQSDVFIHSELCANLRLAPGTTMRDAAIARNAFTEKRVLDDFYAGLLDMSSRAGESTSRSALEARFRLPVMCTSAMDAQKIEGLRDVIDGPPAVWGGNCEGTQIPRLRRKLSSMTLAYRSQSVIRDTDALVRFGTSLELLLRDNDQDALLTTEMRSRARSSYDAVVQCAPIGHFNGPLDTFDQSLAKAFGGSVTPQLMAGARDAESDCLQTARKWSASQQYGGLHWATYKATLRRDGEWRINMNQQLSEPIFSAVSVHWERVFIETLSTQVVQLGKHHTEAMHELHAQVVAALVNAGISAELLEEIRATHVASLAGRIEALKDEMRALTQTEQKELSRAIVPSVRDHMRPGYAHGFAEKGTGSHRRRCAIVEGHILKFQKDMFQSAIKPVTAGLEALRGKLRNLATRVLVTDMLRELRLCYSASWDEGGPDSNAARELLRSPVHEAVCEARQALMRLEEAQGVPRAKIGEVRGAPVETGDDDTELKDVTEEWQQQRAAAVAVIEITEEDDTHAGPWISPVIRTSPGSIASPGSIVVKTEESWM